MKLTKRTLDAATYQGEGNARFVLWDDELPGFGCRIYPGGRKAFVLSYRTQGRKRLMTIGTYGAWTVDKARKAARSHLASVETKEADPLEERQKAARGETVRDLCGAYMERHGNAKKSGADDKRRIGRYILPAWGNLKAAAIKRADVASLHMKIGKRAPYEANRVLALLSKMFELARRWGFVPEGHPNPARDIDRFKEQKRDRWITPEELPRLAQAINEEPNQSARFALWLYLLTGARKSELLQARWEDVSFERAELRLPETKAGRPHYIPLSAPTLALLQQIPREEGNPHILPGKLTGAHLVNIAKPWSRVRKTAGVEDVRLHDLRRTVGSWLAQAGNSLHLIGRVLNHSNQSTTAIYARFAQDQVRDALEQHAARLLGAAGITETADVVELKKPKRGAA
ncbi:MAG: tyrosine-type recombinase/integrase [Pseudomonadota bacterium]|nr:tyrosine-type recombinase/integrase [Pseudomonadota bacterium]